MEGVDAALCSGQAAHRHESVAQGLALLVAFDRGRENLMG